VLRWANAQVNSKILASNPSAQTFCPSGRYPCPFPPRPSQPPLICPEVNKYLKKAETFRQLLLLLIIFTSGMSIRGTEVSSLKRTNDWGSMRNFFIINGSAVALAEYNMSQSTTERPKVIARYLPPALARLYVAYVVDVLPFIEFALDRATAPKAANTNLVWADDDGRPMEMAHISNIMG